MNVCIYIYIYIYIWSHVGPLIMLAHKVLFLYLFNKQNFKLENGEYPGIKKSFFFQYSLYFSQLCFINSGMFCSCFELKFSLLQTETVLIKKELLRFLFVSFAETTYMQ